MSKLKDYCDYETEKVLVSQLNNKNYVGVDNMIQNKGGIFDSEYLPNSGYATKFSTGDILIGNIRPYLKKIWYASFDGGCSPDVLCLKVNGEVSSKYVYACLCQDSFFDFVMKGCKGTKMPRGDKNRIMEFPIHVSNDKCVGDFVYAITQKIKINNRINDNLQQVSRMIYNHFFEAKLGYQKSTNVCSFEDLVKEITTGLNPRNHFKLTKEGYSYITVKNLTTSGCLSFNGCDHVDESAAFLIQKRACVSKGDILFSSIAPLGRCYAVLSDPVDWVINESVFCIKPKNKELQHYLYFYLTSERFIKNAENSSTGSIFSGIRISTLNSLHLYKPNNQELGAFNDSVEPLLAKIEKNNLENRHLYCLRDFLLPLLMNGQATIVD